MKGKEKVGYVMGEFKDGKLKSSSGKTVTDRNQAMAIAMSEAGINKKCFLEAGWVTAQPFKAIRKAGILNGN